MISIKDFELSGFRITWRLLDIGFRGSALFSDQLSSRDIIDYATNKLVESDDTDIIALACEYEPNTDKVAELLGKLANKENSEYDHEFTKWKVVYVLTYLPKDDADYIQGLVDIGDIWVDLGFPQDSPHIFQGVENEITPEEYYTLANYKLLHQRHLDWISERISQLKALSYLFIFIIMSI
jgi:hypothetical protein